MSCDFDRIDALLRGSLPEEERAQVLAHIQRCSVCRAYCEALSGLEGTQTPPEGFSARVMEQVRRTPQKRARAIPYRKIISAIAACAVLVIGISAAPYFGVGKNSSSASGAPDMADLARSGEAEAQSQTLDDADSADDLPLTVHTLTEETLCAQVRAWLAQNGKAPLYGEDAAREAYELTLDEVNALNQAIPDAALPQQTLQLELKSAP